MVTKAKLLKREIKSKDIAWALSVKARDNNVCVLCGSPKLLNAHHIISRSIKLFRNDIDNGLSLCPLHHQFSREISAHKGSFIFYKFFLLSPKYRDQLERLYKKWQEYKQNGY